MNIVQRFSLLFAKQYRNISMRQKLPLKSIERCCSNQVKINSGLQDLTSRKRNQFTPNPVDDPNQFGTLSPSGLVDHERFSNDEGDRKEDERSSYRPFRKKLSTKQYADIIKSYLNERKIKEAIDVLEVRMLQEDRVKPENYIYNLLIGGCGRVGYTKKAFMLFNDMKKRGLSVHAGAYTALFNACANSPWTEDGLSRAHKLRTAILESGYKPNEPNYNAMIKAFGRLGDIQSAFSLVDEMIKNFSLKTETINFLLQACISSKSDGFRYALIVWRKMISKGLSPDIYSFNLILRAVRDCELGDVQNATQEIRKIVNSTNIEIGTKTQILLPTETITDSLKTTEDVDNCKGSKFQKVAIDALQIRPNLLAKIPHLGDIIDLEAVEKPEERLLLVGGCSGFLNELDVYKIIPDVKIFTQLLDNIPSTIAAEKHLMAEMKCRKIKPDVDFFNMLIKKRSMRFDHDSGKVVLDMIYAAGLRPDLITYGVLALGCRTKEDAEYLIKTMEESDYRINSEILGAMLQQACYRNNFRYVLKVMEVVIQEDIRLNTRFIEHLTSFQAKCSNLVKDKDSKKFVQSKYFQEGFRQFNLRFKTWQTEITMDSAEMAHPWSQYRQPYDSDVQNYKDKAAASRFKARRLSRFKVKTSTKIRY